jgi:hypothetical protein
VSAALQRTEKNAFMKKKNVLFYFTDASIAFSEGGVGETALSDTASDVMRDTAQAVWNSGAGKRSAGRAAQCQREVSLHIFCIETLFLSALPVLFRRHAHASPE